jgi:hypothetical protein
MTRMAGRIFKTGVDVSLFEVRKIPQDFLRSHIAGEHFQHLAGRNRIPRIVGSLPQTSGMIVMRSIDMVLSYENIRRTQSDFDTKQISD